MKCIKVRESLSDYVDGLVSPRVREEISEHIAVCVHCARDVETTTQMLSAVSKLGNQKAPINLWPAVQVTIEQQGARRRDIWGSYLVPVFRPLIAVPVAAAAVAAVLLMQTLHQPTNEAATASVKSAEMAAYVQEYSEFRSKQSFGDTSSLIAAQLERPARRGD